MVLLDTSNLLDVRTPFRALPVGQMVYYNM
jgi:hypothetical protein